MQAANFAHTAVMARLIGKSKRVSVPGIYDRQDGINGAVFYPEERLLRINNVDGTPRFIINPDYLPSESGCKSQVARKLAQWWRKRRQEYA